MLPMILAKLYFLTQNAHKLESKIVWYACGCQKASFKKFSSFFLLKRWGKISQGSVY